MATEIKALGLESEKPTIIGVCTFKSDKRTLKTRLPDNMKEKALPFFYVYIEDATGFIKLNFLGAGVFQSYYDKIRLQTTYEITELVVKTFKKDENEVDILELDCSAKTAINPHASLQLPPAEELKISAIPHHSNGKRFIIKGVVVEINALENVEGKNKLVCKVADQTGSILLVRWGDSAMTPNIVAQGAVEIRGAEISTWAGISLLVTQQQQLVVLEKVEIAPLIQELFSVSSGKIIKFFNPGVQVLQHGYYRIVIEISVNGGEKIKAVVWRAQGDKILGDPKSFRDSLVKKGWESFSKEVMEKDFGFVLGKNENNQFVVDYVDVKKTTQE